jgi:hypothetical protein
MKSKLMKKTLAVLALASLGLMATGAQADVNRSSNGYGYGDRRAPFISSNLI